VDSRRGGSLPLELHRALDDPSLQAKVSDLEFAHAALVLDVEPVNDAPILDLRLRKGVRLRGLKLAVASPHPSSLDACAALSVRYAVGAGAVFAAALSAALGGAADAEQLARQAGAEPDAVRELAQLLKGEAAAPAPGDDATKTPAHEVVVLWGERLTAGPAGAAGAQALLALADGLGVAGTDGAGLLEVPAASNGRGLREAGVLPGVGPGLSEITGETPASDAHAIAEGLAGGDLAALYLLQCDPLRDLPERELWERALAGASTVVAHTAFLTDGIREHATVVFPAEVYAEKEGTIVHPDGRLQRLRPAIARAGNVRAGWQLLAELALRVGLDLDVLSGAMASKQLFAAIPFYAGLTLEEIGGRGVRWQERDGVSAFPHTDAETLRGAGATPAGAGPTDADFTEGAAEAADLAGWRSVWDAAEVEHSPALDFLFPRENVVLPLSYSGGERA
jgi:NADH-quinone oxidoreductase subunit G